MKKGTFQEEYRWVFLTLGCMCGYPPGLEKVVTKSTRIFFKWIAFIPVALAVTHCLIMYHYIITKEQPRSMFFLRFRRNVLFTYFSFKLVNSFVRHKKFDELLLYWNENFQLDGDLTRRKAIIDDKMRKSYLNLFFCFFGAVMMAQLINARAFADPHGKLSAELWYPHSIDSPYHFLCMFLILTLYVMGPPGCYSIDVTRFQTILLLSSQLDMLHESLQKIVQMPHTKKEEQELAYNDLLKWIKTHQKTVKWKNDIQSLFVLDISNKYACMALYTCLLAISIPAWVKHGQIMEMLTITALAIGNISILFYTTSLLDKIETQSQNIFTGSYDRQWYDHPQRSLNCFKIISLYCMSKPMKFTAFKLYNDNSQSFLSVIELAYKILSFLLQMPDEE